MERASKKSHGPPIERPDPYSIYFPTCASTLNRRALGVMYPEGSGADGKKHPLQNPATKKTYPQIGSKVSTGQKRKSAQVAQQQSDGLTAKKRDEMFGRVRPDLLAQFLHGKMNQGEFIARVRSENGDKTAPDTDFNFIDAGYTKPMGHAIRLNKRPLTGVPPERFGRFTQTLFKINNSKGMPKNSETDSWRSGPATL